MVDYRNGANQQNLGIAMVQADVVAHSMGGIIARAMTRESAYGRDTSFGKGAIHKLITIDTPHQGSPLAPRLLLPEERCIQDLFANNRNPVLKSATVAGLGTIAGGVGDFVDSPQTSAAQLLDTPNSHELNTAFIAGEMTNWNVWTLSQVGTRAWQIRTLVCQGDPLAEALTETGWPAIFNNPVAQTSDGVVGLRSQTRLSSNQRTFPQMLHSKGLRDLGFNGATVLENQEISSYVISLLNLPTANSIFVKIP
jgi:pimeloyl-ACP methyl ester carboxylesterase